MNIKNHDFDFENQIRVYLCLHLKENGKKISYRQDCLKLCQFFQLSAWMIKIGRETENKV